MAHSYDLFGYEELLSVATARPIAGATAASCHGMAHASSTSSGACINVAQAAQTSAVAHLVRAAPGRYVCRGASSAQETLMSAILTLTPEQLAEFDRRGLLRL